MGINVVAKHGLSHVMGLKTNFCLRKPFSHLGISVLREKEIARACEERRLVIFFPSNQEFERSRGRMMLGIEESKD